MEKLDLLNVKKGWIVENKLNSPENPESTLAAKACFYSFNMAKWLPKDSEPFED